MPTLIDDAVSNAKKEIAASVQNYDESPLFRAEVQMHEMNFLDRFLFTDNNDTAANESAEGNGEINGLEIGQSVSDSGLNHYGGYGQSKIAQLMGPNSYRDSPLPAPAAPNDSKDSLSNNFQKKETFSDTRDTNQNNTGNATVGTNTSHIQRKRNATNRSPLKTCKSKNKQNSKRPVPSRNKRRQINHRFIQKAKVKSHQLATKMIKFVGQCTRNAQIVSHVILDNINAAANKIHIMLEEKKKDVAEVTSSDASGGVNTGQKGQDRSRGITPVHAFPFTSKWAGVNVIRQQATSFVKNSIQNRKNLR